METYIATMMAKPGHADAVAKFYAEMEPMLREAPGFHGRKIYQARTGTMAAAVRKMYSPEELGKHAEPPHDDPGTLFIMVERWDSVDARLQFSKSMSSDRSKELIPHLLPEHSHEFYDEVPVD